MDPSAKRSTSSRALFGVVVLVVVYVLLNIAVAINTVDDCGDESSPKHWSFSPPDSWQLFPPEWICESPDGF
jgi:hypothetical protein